MSTAPASASVEPRAIATTPNAPDPPGASPRASRSARWAARCAWGLWYLLSALAFLQALRDATPVPLAGELARATEALLPAAPAARDCLEPGVLGSAPFARAVYVAIVRWAADARAIGIASVALASALAAASLFVARRRRGAHAWSDAVFPLAWLHIGLAPAWSDGLAFEAVLATFFAGCAALVIASSPRELGRRRELALGALAVLLAGCGVAGIAWALMLVVWRLMASRGARASWWTGACALVALALAALVSIDSGTSVRDGVDDAGAVPFASNFAAWIAFALRTLGPATDAWQAVALVLLGVACVSAALARSRSIDEADARVRGCASLLAGAALIAVARTSARWSSSDACVASDVALAAFVPAGLALLALAADARGAWRVNALLALALVLAWTGNARFAAERSERRRMQAVDLVVDQRDGAGPMQLAARYSHALGGNENRARELLALREALRLAPFDRTPTVEPSSPPTPRDVPLVREPFGVLGTPPTSWEGTLPPFLRSAYGKVVLALGPRARLRFAVPALARRVRADYGVLAGVGPQSVGDGLVFRASLVRAGEAPRVLFERHLDPAHVEADRSAFELDAEWSSLASADEPLEGCELVLETDDLPGANDVDDLGYFARVAFE